MTPAIVCTLAAAAGTPLLLALFRRIEPLRHRADPRSASVSFERSLAAWERVSLLLTMLLVTALGALLWWLLRGLYQGRLAGLETRGILIPIPDIVWTAPALFAALFGAAFIMEPLLRRCLGEGGYAAYVERLDRRYGVNSRRLLRWLAAICLPCCIALTLLALDCYARVTERHFVINDYWGLGERVYRLDRINRVTRVAAALDDAHYDAVPDYYRLEFADGNSFGFYRQIEAVDLGLQHRIASRIADLAGLVIVMRDAAEIR